LALLLVAGILVLGGLSYYYISAKNAEEAMQSGENMMDEGNAMEGDEAMMGDDSTMSDDSMKDADAMMDDADHMMNAEFSGTVLAGSPKSAPLLDFNQADYETAVKSGKLVVLFFYANWCPVCKEEFPKMESAFNSLTSKEVVGFRVNYSDNQTDKDEEALAREFGVGYQHTKVFVKNGERILKAPESWSEAKFASTINANL